MTRRRELDLMILKSVARFLWIASGPLSVIGFAVLAAYSAKAGDGQCATPLGSWWLTAYAAAWAVGIFFTHKVVYDIRHEGEDTPFVYDY